MDRVYTGRDSSFLNHLKDRIRKAESIDIIVSFLRFSGLRLLLDDLKDATRRRVPIRILTGTYLSITEPFALSVLLDELEDCLELHIFDSKAVSFHPKAWFFTVDGKKELCLGSSNMTRSALLDGIEWNHDLYCDQDAIAAFHAEFERLWEEESFQADADFVKTYAESWTRPMIDAPIIKADPITVEPNDVQCEALYALDRTRREGADKALIQAATGIGKTMLAAFDSRPFSRVLFIAHRHEILEQAAKAFSRVRPSSSQGFHIAGRICKDADIVFASVATIGRHGVLEESGYRPDDFDYIVVDEFHHAVASSYQRVLSFFKPRFMLALTATAERLDRQSVYALCDYNVPYRITLAAAIDRGALVPFHYYGVYDDSVDYKQVAKNGGHYNIKDLVRHLDNKERAGLIYKNYARMHSSRALGFTSSKDQALYMAHAFNEHGTPSAAVFSGQSGDALQYSRDEALDALSDGRLNVIFCVDVFNEGVDVPQLDLVMFLRPTESPVIFLQQLGRGLRKAEGKDHLDVLDFIGNYDNAHLIPSLLTRKAEQVDMASELEAAYMTPSPKDLPNGCIVDIDFRLLALFERMRRDEESIEDKIRLNWKELVGAHGQSPSRVDLFKSSSGEMLSLMYSHPRLNPLRDYLGFRLSMGVEIDPSYISSPAAAFIKMIEGAAMTKSYKIPVLQTFIGNDGVRDSVSLEELASRFKTFYANGIMKADMDKDAKTRGFTTWTSGRIARLVRDNPVKYLCSSAPNFLSFNGTELSLSDVLKPWLDHSFFSKRT